MQKIELGRLIAERVLDSSNARKVIVKIGAPQRTESNDFVTPYQIIGAGDEAVRFAAGLDSVQSLQLAFQMIGADLNYGLAEYGLKWADRDDSGFPAP